MHQRREHSHYKQKDGTLSRKGRMEEYRNLMDAINLLRNAQGEVQEEDGCSPAWYLLDASQQYLESQAKNALRNW